jgi:cyclophilin family peptidyl-prolyl cis-trans isomerase/HEAT repeat protein
MRPHRYLAVILAVAAGACASAPPQPSPSAVAAAYDQKVSGILQLENERVLQLTPPPPAPSPRGKHTAPAAPALDLPAMLKDENPAIRWRAALAIGRIGLPEGVASLVPVLKDTDTGVRQEAAFALGLLGDRSAVVPLTAALQDADPKVRGRAAEALGLIGDAAGASASGQMAEQYIRAGALAQLAPDEEAFPGTPESDAVRLALFSLVRLKAWDPLAAAVLDSSGRPVSAWWPVAYALQRSADRRAAPALRQLAAGQGRYTVGFAVRGLGELHDAQSVSLIERLLNRSRTDTALAATMVRALAAIGGPEAAKAVAAMVGASDIDPNLRLEAVRAAGTLKARQALPVVQDLLTADWPTMRAAALRAAAAIDPGDFLLTLSGMEVDAHWMVRAALADVLASIPGDPTLERLRGMLQDADRRVVPHVLASLAERHAPGLDAVLMSAIKDPDYEIRAAAAEAIGQLKLPAGPDALRAAYKAGAGDAAYSARTAALDALAKYGGQEAGPTLRAALADKDWAVRVHAADVLLKLDPNAKDAEQTIRPAPAAPAETYSALELVRPPFSPHAYIDTAKGTIEVELDVVAAPLTSHNFVTLARKGFFNGLQIHRVVPNFVVQDGDPRGDGSGGPGYTIRDELSDRAYVRGTVGMALEWRDTGGSQFFITLSPQPHLDGKYTVFGHVVSGMDVADRLQELDTIQRVRIWDGKEMK